MHVTADLAVREAVDRGWKGGQGGEWEGGGEG